MKKLLVFFMCVFSVFGIAQQVSAAATDTQEIYLHYYRYNSDYTGWGVWAWQYQPTGEEGTMFTFEEDTTAAEYNYGGVVAVINVDDNFPDITQMGLIVNLNSWAEKDVSNDRFVTIPATSEGGEAHFYLVEGDANIGTSKDDPNGPDKSPKFKQAYFTAMDTIKFTTTEQVEGTDVKVYADDTLLVIDSYTIDGITGTVVINQDLDFSKSYRIESDFSSDNSTNDYDVTFDGIYDSEEFEDAFTYNGELGAIVDGNTTTFRVWAPVSASVSVNLYSTGTNANDGGTDDVIATYPMTQGEKGTWSYESNTNLHGTYYTYSVTNGDVTSELVDPYAKSVGVNGYRGLVVDFSQVNPEGFTYNTRANNMTNHTDAIIYELHVRDLTTSSTWNGTEANRGKYLGLIEEGTTYEGVTTGFDHIKELGVTHIQLLPFFDYGVVDETRLDDEDYNSFNWGYMPLNFNALEGTYSSNPYDGLVRIEEMKQVVMAFTDANLRINMDVVYNHTGLSADSNFNLIVPGYYYRLTNSGAFSNGSGTGNETASERSMMQKFMVDSVVFWATEYNISGFRFDLMGLHDSETMELLASELHAIDPTIMVYGEPWTGGTTPLSPTLKVDKNNVMTTDGVGAFNDTVRDGIKGSVFQREAGGWIHGDISMINKVKYGIVGGVSHDDVLITTWHGDASKTINYVACHDNNTLYDKLYLTLVEDDELDMILPLAKQAYGIVLTSQGIPFIHAGDEFLRSKPDDSTEGFDHNSYESPDSVNQIDWSLKVSEDGSDMYNYVKGLIELRLEHDLFRKANTEDIQENLDFLYEDTERVIAYRITEEAEQPVDYLVIHNANTKNVKLTLPTGGGWVLVVNGEEVLDATDFVQYEGGSRISVEENSTYVLYQDIMIPDYNPVPTIIISVVGGLAVIAAGVFVFLKLKKK